ncbi:ABC-type nitrate/sulfonate/bicarbonate transport system substrate-binding protein [Bosea sp. BE125]|uniref:ABC transporter substrate-binding protein n=1 Tax=Bosea sp. BE125 TaxID=2817909 RepID=UPI00285BC25D|nr:ABC transporter substrate-binding protein [Bosea sp. BE125]MDR6874681.1 ABC-type nitrate/sulfonate/bicarbonate transport system substrate-binding protein [Bosea sp. BE125]
MTTEWSFTRRAALAAGAAMLGCAGAPAQDARPIRLVAFAGASNWPIWIGQQKGFFAAEKLQASLEITPNSRQMAADIFSGKFDVALTAIDNVVAYVEDQGEAQLPGPADFVAFMGVDDGMLSLMAVPGTKSVSDLKGKELSVDALTTGFAFVLRDALMKSGIGADEVKFVAVGGGAQRLAALREQKQTATLLNSPLDLIAESAGSVRLAEMHALIGPYQGISGMGRRAWLAENRDTAKAFLRAFHASVAWLVDPASKDEAIAILRERVQGTSPELAQRIHARLTHPERGIKRDSAIDIEGLRTVLRLRSTYAAAGQTLSDPSRYLDSALLGEALARR